MVTVRAFRTFKYPKSALDKVQFIGDATYKAQHDLQVIINEILVNDHAEVNVAALFEFEAIEDVAYKFRKRQIEVDRPGDFVGRNKAAKALTNHKMEQKYGPLNHEQNPGLYELDPEIRDPQGDLLREATWYMREEIEREYYQYYDDFREILRAAAN